MTLLDWFILVLTALIVGIAWWADVQHHKYEKLDAQRRRDVELLRQRDRDR